MGAGAGAAGMPSMMPPTMAGGPIVMARNFAVMTGVNAGISAYLKQKRGVEDVQGTMIASFGSGAAFAVVSKLGLPPGTMAPPMPGMPPRPHRHHRHVAAHRRAHHRSSVRGAAGEQYIAYQCCISCISGRLKHALAAG